MTERPPGDATHDRMQVVAVRLTVPADQPTVFQVCQRGNEPLAFGPSHPGEYDINVETLKCDELLSQPYRQHLAEQGA